LIGNPGADLIQALQRKTVPIVHHHQYACGIRQARHALSHGHKSIMRNRALNLANFSLFQQRRAAGCLSCRDANVMIVAEEMDGGSCWIVAIITMLYLANEGFSAQI
jgi:hypothetical protein